MPTKPKTNQPETPDINQSRDNFQTPHHAVDLLIPYIPKHIKTIYDPCAGYNGYGRIRQRLEYHGYKTYGSDIIGTENIYNFITGNSSYIHNPFFIKGIEGFVLNPPYSLKKKFYQKLILYNKPFAMLIPADYSGWVIHSIDNDFCEKIIPIRRINYITPNILDRIKTAKAIEYKSIDDVPSNVLYKHSNAQFHSMWLCYKFNIGRTETFVDLPIEYAKQNM